MIKHTSSVASAVFAYEAAALASAGRIPTITRLCARHRWLGAVTVAALIVHLLPGAASRVADVDRGGAPPVVP